MLFGGLIMLGVIFVATVIRAVRGRTHAAHTEQPHQEYKTTQAQHFSFPFWNISARVISQVNPCILQASKHYKKKTKKTEIKMIILIAIMRSSFYCCQLGLNF